MKEEILTELRKEIDNKFEEIKKVNDERYELHLSDDDLMDIPGHGQYPNEN